MYRAETRSRRCDSLRHRRQWANPVGTKTGPGRFWSVGRKIAIDFPFTSSKLAHPQIV